MSSTSLAREAIRDSLTAGEVVREASSAELVEPWGYYMHAVTSPSGAHGDTVYLEMPLEGSCVEAEDIVGDIELNIEAIYGSGWLIVDRATTKRTQAYDLTAQESRVITLQKGDQYAYFNPGKEPFVVRDEAPGFRASDEIPATSPRLLRFLSHFSNKF